jgi:hypothetical protein
MSCYDDILATAGAVEERLNAILPQARAVIEFLDSRLHDLFTDLECVERILRDSKVELPPREEQLRQQGRRYYKGLEELKVQYAELRDQEEKVIMLLADHLQARLLDSPSYVIQDKDSTACFK